VPVTLPTDGGPQSWIAALTGLGTGAGAITGHAPWWAPALVVVVMRCAYLVERLAIIFAKGTPAQIRSRAVALEALRGRSSREERKKGP
jgi:hypothetical protein